MKQASKYEVAVVIPNYNGIAFIENCLNALRAQEDTAPSTEIVVVDNGSTDGSREIVEQNYPEVRVIALGENTGFCCAVNEGIKGTDAPFVILLNNDTEVLPGFVRELYEGIRRYPDVFSCEAKMIQLHDKKLLDDAGNFYCALGWAFARGKGASVDRYRKADEIFASCGGAAIYRRKILDEIGLFDEEHFAYLEDVDIGYRAKRYGYRNLFLPKAKVYHAGSGTSGSRYNEFKVRYASRNSVYLIYKNMPMEQIIFNLPLLLTGFGIKFLFFLKKGMGLEYAAGVKNGLALCVKHKKQGKDPADFSTYFKIQMELWINLVRRLFA